VDGRGLSFCRLDNFGLNVDGLPNFVESALLHAAFASHMSRDLEFLAIGVGIDTRVELRGAPTQLNVERARQEECPESERLRRTRTGRDEVCGSRDESRGCDPPPQDGPPQVDSGCDADAIGHRRPKHGLARGFEAKRRRSERGGGRDESKRGVTRRLRRDQDLSCTSRAKVSQGLKPGVVVVLSGTAEAVPFPKLSHP
jgi:hypothetical protein